jgi:MFS family permease
VSAPTARRSALHTMSRGRRRALVLVMQLGMVAYALTFAFSGTDSWWDVVLALCLQVLYMVIFSRVLQPIMSEVIKKDRDLDERELSLRNAAHYHAYQILSSALTTITAVPLGASLYFGLDLPLQLTHWHFMALFFLFMNLSLSLPASVVAWTEPDPEPEDL